VRNVVLVLGDQLDFQSAAFDGFDKTQDVVWMAEVAQESTHVWCHKLRIAYFLSAMRHFRDLLRIRNYEFAYHQLTADPLVTVAVRFLKSLRRMFATCPLRN
jgi:deoxyribodipyrimidine photolyase-related protein